MTELDQICLWVAGHSVHDDGTMLCVPDWSCCMPELLAPHETREAYLMAYVGQSDAEERRAKEAALTTQRTNLRFLLQFLIAKGQRSPDGELPRENLIKTRRPQTLGCMECELVAQSDEGPILECVAHEGAIHGRGLYRAEESQRLYWLRTWLDVKGYRDRPHRILSRDVTQVHENYHIVTYRVCVSKAKAHH